LKKLADSFKRIGLIGNVEKAACADAVRTAAAAIRRAGREVCSDAVTAQLAGLRCQIKPNTAALARSVDLLLVFGGDGTMLHAASQSAGSNTPILGVNIGGLGFLTAIPSADLIAGLKLVWRGEFRYEKRALIEAEGTGHGHAIRTTALNDIVINRGPVSRLIALDVTVNDMLVTRYRCDGLIISSPTGSTAYSLAAGGAIVMPSADVFALTPICPHALSNRSIIMPLSATIRVKAVSSAAETVVNADGQMVGELSADDEIVVRRSRHSVRIVHLAGSTFFEALSRKLHWRGTYL